MRRISKPVHWALSSGRFNATFSRIYQRNSRSVPPPRPPLFACRKPRIPWHAENTRHDSRERPLVCCSGQCVCVNPSATGPRTRRQVVRRRGAGPAHAPAPIPRRLSVGGVVISPMRAWRRTPRDLRLTPAPSRRACRRPPRRLWRQAGPCASPHPMLRPVKDPCPGRRRCSRFFHPEPGA